MSQQMHFEEEPRGYQATYTPALEENSGSYPQPAAHMPGQKIGLSYSGGGASPGQRLALAIVSMVVLLGGLAILSNGFASTYELVAKLIGLMVICLTTLLINVVFNWRR